VTTYQEFAASIIWDGFQVVPTYWEPCQTMNIIFIFTARLTPNATSQEVYSSLMTILCNMICD
jgi:hypothetical protein